MNVLDLVYCELPPPPPAQAGARTHPHLTFQKGPPLVHEDVVNMKTVEGNFEQLDTC